MKRPIFSWDPEEGTALCIIQDKEKTYYGIANCSPEDRDMMSEKTGCFIAEKRAYIMALQDFRDKLRIELRALKRFYYSINTSKYFDSKSYEVRRLISHIEMTKKDIEDTKKVLEYEKQQLKDYLKDKEIFYKKIRRNREKNNLQVKNK